MIHNLFPTRVWMKTVSSEVQNEVGKAIQNVKWDYYKEENWGRSQKFTRPNPFDYDVIHDYNMRGLMEEIITAVQLMNPNFVPSRQTSWITRYDKGDYAHVHTHRPAVYSGAYWYKVNDENNFFFQNTTTDEIFAPQVSEGMLSVFPSWLLHGVKKVETDSRIVLSFNLY